MEKKRVETIVWLLLDRLRARWKEFMVDDDVGVSFSTAGRGYWRTFYVRAEDFPLIIIIFYDFFCENGTFQRRNR